MRFSFIESIYTIHLFQVEENLGRESVASCALPGDAAAGRRLQGYLAPLPGAPSEAICRSPDSGPPRRAVHSLYWFMCVCVYVCEINVLDPDRRLHTHTHTHTVGWSGGGFINYRNWTVSKMILRYNRLALAKKPMVAHTPHIEIIPKVML